MPLDLTLSACRLVLERQRLCRARRKAGDTVVLVEVPMAVKQHLVRLGYLSEAQTSEKPAVANAVEELLRDLASSCGGSSDVLSGR